MTSLDISTSFDCSFGTDLTLFLGEDTSKEEVTQILPLPTSQTCSNCNKPFPNLFSLCFHFKSCSNLSYFSCCTFQSTSLSSLHSHVLKHTLSSLPCPSCPTILTNSRAFLSHLKIHVIQLENELEDLNDAGEVEYGGGILGVNSLGGDSGGGGNTGGGDCDTSDYRRYDTGGRGFQGGDAGHCVGGFGSRNCKSGDMDDFRGGDGAGDYQGDRENEILNYCRVIQSPTLNCTFCNFRTSSRFRLFIHENSHDSMLNT